MACILRCNRRLLTCPLFLALLLSACSTGKKASQSPQEPIAGLKFLHVKEIPFGLTYAQTTVGGLSSIDYDPATNEYALVCDDRSNTNPARFYTAKLNISNNRIDSIWFTGMHYLRQPNGDTFPASSKDPARAADPESLRFHFPTQTYLWTSEGENAVRDKDTVLLNPWIWFMEKDGRYRDSFPLPDILYMRSGNWGPRTNGVFEGAGFDPAGKKLYVNVEEPLKQDGPRVDTFPQNTWLRFFEFDAKTKKNTAQWAYAPATIEHQAQPATAYKINGVPEILPLGGAQFLVLERAFSTGRLACSIKIFLADASEATDVKDLPSLAQTPPAKPMRKKLLFNLDDLGIFTDNVEGITFGPRLANGNRSLLLVADNNFSPLEKQQFFLFEVLPPQ